MKSLKNTETLKNLMLDLEKRVEDGILERNNLIFIKKLLEKAEDENEAITICKLGTTYNKTGLIYDRKLEIPSESLKFFTKNEKYSFNNGKLKHKLIVGDNYDALLNLLVQYRNKIDIIYIDPPYGVNSIGEFALTNYDNQITRDNLLSILWPRLVLAKQLLSDDGIIFCSLDDKNQAYVKLLFDDVFGEKNFIENFIFIKNSGGSLTNFTLSRHEYVLFYCKNKEETLNNNPDIFKMQKPGYEDVNNLVNDCRKRGKSIKETENLLKNFYKDRDDLKGIKLYFNIDENWKVYRELPITAPNNNFYEIIHPVTGKPVKIPNRGWSWSKATMLENIKNGRVVFGKDETKVPGQKLYLNEAQFEHKRSTYQADQAEGNKILKQIFGEKQIFDNPKPLSLLKYLMENSKKDSIILDFFAGSGTTAHAVFDLNKEDGGSRTVILCTLDEEIEPTTQTSVNAIEILDNLKLPKIISSITHERLRRIMTGKTILNSSSFEWIEKNKPYLDSLEVLEFKEKSIFDEKVFNEIDETLYGIEKFKNIKDKIKWVSENFEKVARSLKDVKRD